MTEPATAESAAARPREHRKKKETREFFRACRFLLPYRRMVITSILAALFVGGVTTVGLSAMVPVLRVLLNDDTLQGWADRQIAEKRLGVRLSEERGDEQILRTNPDGVAAKAGLKRGDPIRPVEKFADPATRDVTVQGVNGPVAVTLPPVPTHLQVGRNIVHRLPLHPVKAIAVVFAFIVGLTVISNIARFFQEYLSDKSAISAVMDIRRHLYDHILHMPMSFFGTRGTSDVTSRLVSDSQVLQDGFKIILGQTVQEPIKMLFALGLAVYISYPLTIFIIVFAPVMFWVIKKFGKK